MLRLLTILLAISVLGVTSEHDSHEAEYCDICEYHTMCGTTVPGPSCVNHASILPGEDDKKDILHLHNSLRNKVANANEPRGNPGPQYQAANMMKMNWDDELATNAQRAADQCVYKRDCKACRLLLHEPFNVGQNIAAISRRSRPYSSVDFTRLAELWYERNIDEMDSQAATGYRSEGWSQLAQFIWWNARLIGCGASVFSKGDKHYQLLFCNYGSAGSTINSRMYDIGKPGSRCPEGSTNSDPVYDALCVIEDQSHEGHFHTDNVLFGHDGMKMRDPTCVKTGFREFYPDSN